jgi:chloride channel 3/4/5
VSYAQDLCDFKLNVGPRVILVSHEGQLVGLVTVKDVLRHEAKIHHKESQHAASPPSTARSARLRPDGPGHRPHDSNAFSDDDGWGSWDQEDTRGHGFEVLLEDVYAWARIKGSRLYNIAYAAVRSRSGSMSGHGGQGVSTSPTTARGRDVEFEYELESGDRR